MKGDALEHLTPEELETVRRIEAKIRADLEGYMISPQDRDATLLAVASNYKQMLVSTYGEMVGDVTAHWAFACRHEGPEGRCEWLTKTEGEACPFHRLAAEPSDCILLDWVLEPPAVIATVRVD